VTGALADALDEALSKQGSFEVVQLDDLSIDHSYQRDLDPNLVEQISSQWDPKAAQVLLISRRADGSLWIVNGQHCAAGAKMRGLVQLPAQVHEGLTVKQEAALRLKANTRKGDKSLERFKAQVAAGDAESKDIVKILAGFDTQINQWPNQHEGVNCVAAIEFLYRRDRGVMLTRTLEVVKDAYGRVDGEYAKVVVFKGIAWILEKHERELDRARVVEKLRTIGVEALGAKMHMHKAALGGPGWLNFYRSLVEVYNDKLGQAAKLEWKVGSWTRGDGKNPTPNFGRSGAFAG
jgi:hypothetical protein